jgi:hypothetical protein
LGQVHVYPQAVTDASGEIRFYRSTASDNSGLSSIVPGAGRAEEAEVVPCLSLDDFAAALPGGRRFDLVKIDVEDAELQVLAGARAILSHDRAPALVFESRYVDAVASVLGPHGYSIRQLHYTLARGLELIELGTTFHNIFAEYEPPNYFAAKDVAVFENVVAQSNARRSPALRVLGWV